MSYANQNKREYLMATVSEETKKRVGLMTDEDIEYEINLGHRSHFQRESFAWLQTVKSQREKLAKESREVPNPAPNPSSTSTQKITNEKQTTWQDKTLYYIAVGVIIFMLGVFLVYLIRKHLGIPL
jgi:hypothetical protein